MKILLFLFSLSTVICLAFGATAIELPDNTTDHAGYCYSKRENVGAMGKYEIKTLKDECIQVTCNEDKSIGYYSCGVVSTEPECKLTADLTKLYPDCCPKCLN